MNMSEDSISGQKYNGSRVREFYGENRPKMVYNGIEFVADRKIIELNHVESIEADVFYEGWLEGRRHKIRNEDLEINKGKTIKRNFHTTVISDFSMLILSITSAKRQHASIGSQRTLSH